MAWSSAHGASPISPASLLKRLAYSSRRSRDRASPLSAFSRNTMRAPSCVDIFRESPFSFTLTGTLRMRFTSVARLRTPLRRPAGLPDRPARNWVCCGGLPYPTSWPLLSARIDTASLRSDMGFSHRADVDRGGRVSGVAPGLSDRAKGRPLSAWSAVPPVSRCQRSMLASTKIGSSSITRARGLGACEASSAVSVLLWGWQ